MDRGESAETIEVMARAARIASEGERGPGRPAAAPTTHEIIVEATPTGDGRFVGSETLADGTRVHITFVPPKDGDIFAAVTIRIGGAA